LPSLGDVERVDLTAETLRAADAVVLVTDHSDVDYQLVCDEATYILDTRHHLSPADHIEAL
jgi:UDP-N-acetyl-D-mannosaminuronate dehydrogenase